MMFLVSNWIVFGLFGSAMTFFRRSVTHQYSRAQSAPLPQQGIGLNKSIKFLKENFSKIKSR